eukprot:PhM_4_TR14023/c0_g1_i1/m.16092
MAYVFPSPSSNPHHHPPQHLSIEQQQEQYQQLVSNNNVKYNVNASHQSSIEHSPSEQQTWFDLVASIRRHCNPDLLVTDILDVVTIGNDFLVTSPYYADGVAVASTSTFQVSEESLQGEYWLFCTAVNCELPHAWMPEVALTEDVSESTCHMEIAVLDGDGNALSPMLTVPVPLASHHAPGSTTIQQIDVGVFIRTLPIGATFHIDVRIISPFVCAVWEGNVVLCFGTAHTIDALVAFVPSTLGMQQVNHNKENDDDDDDGDLELLPQRSSGLSSPLCPLTRLPMTYPARGRACEHMQCFDLKSYITHSLHRHVWTCPVCRGVVRYSDLVLVPDAVMTPEARSKSESLDEKENNKRHKKNDNPKEKSKKNNKPLSNASDDIIELVSD